MLTCFQILTHASTKTCDYFGVCQAVSAHVSQCVCVTQCPSYEDLVCTSIGRTFDNNCTMEREICQTRGNFSYYHPGGCQGICQLSFHKKYIIL